MKFLFVWTLCVALSWLLLYAIAWATLGFLR